MFRGLLESFRGARSHQQEQDVRAIRLKGAPAFKFLVHPPGEDEFISEAIRRDGLWSPVETDIALRLLPLYGLFIDLGANIGWFTALAREVMPKGSAIHAFEPDERNFAFLKQNAGASNRVRLCLTQAAVADEPGTAHLYHAPTNLGDHRLYPSDAGRESISVPVTSLDSYFANGPLPPRLVKMDTQGSEAKIFRGAARTLGDAERTSAYMIEFWPWGLEKSGEDVDDFINRLEALPQVPLVLDWSGHALRRIDWAEIRRRWAANEMDQEDLLLVTPGTPAHRAIADLVKDDE